MKCKEKIFNKNIYNKKSSQGGSKAGYRICNNTACLSLKFFNLLKRYGACVGVCMPRCLCGTACPVFIGSVEEKMESVHLLNIISTIEHSFWPNSPRLFQVFLGHVCTKSQQPTKLMHLHATLLFCKCWPPIC